MNDFQKADLTEEFMPLAMQIAAELDNGTVPLEDLTQEAFLGLVAGLNLVAESDERGEGLPLDRTVEQDERGEGLPLDRTVEQAIREQVLLALAEQEDYMKRDDRLVAEVELLNESINRLTGELGTKPTIDEVANDMGIPQSKVLEILKLMGETLPEGEEYKAARELWEDNPMLRKFL